MTKAKVKKNKNNKYLVIIGCNMSDGTRYEPGDIYDIEKHPVGDAAMLVEMGCLSELDAAEIKEAE